MPNPTKSPRHAADHDTAVLIVASIVLGGLLLPACDSFFTVQGQVTDCASAAPLPAVGIDVHVERGYGDRVESFPDMTTTDGKGRYHVGLNDPSDSWATLTFHHEGYLPLTPPQLKGHTDEDSPVNVCLSRAPTPGATQ
jgi:hypothetical protein